jgi:hypothetical protein
VTSYTILILPIVAQELAFGAWLIIRGFNPGVIAPSAVTGPALAGNPGGMR